ncbi:uncharacterized protein A4U43_C08F31090 [Asparagus officinalis]|uniref:peroxidase 27-like n=1 Tax=Asparagus officinalis TaxID=4686 RepID=UPI00098DE291|nr:peroxidase 27-like [Asparagus officinalis]ONK61546.1 uncharacterized protein A4U43_C08F31090 [Asparagus officinalis]
MKSSFLLILSLAFVIVLDRSTKGQAAAGLENHFYKKTCPQAEEIVQKIIWKHVAANSELAAKFLRMFFHDCFVRGCDASILLDSANQTAEKDAPPNLTLAGFEIIDEAKTALEKACPNTVSCADIVALAARDGVSFQFNASIWEVETGRRDGRVSQIQEALNDIPSPLSDFSTLVQSFASKNLDAKDLVVLSGAHTIGVGHCNLFSNRLYNFTGKGDSDPSLNSTYASFLRTQCKSQSDTTTTVPTDPESSTKFDSNYFITLKQGKGLFQSDAALLTNDRASNIVDKLQDLKNFTNAFKNSIKRMGQVGVVTGSDGEIRKNCRAAN